MGGRQRIKRAMQRMFAARLSEDEQLAADRRAVKRGAVIGGASLIAGGALLRKARGPVENTLLNRYKKPKAMTKAVPKVKGQAQLSPREQEIWSGKSVPQRTEFAERERDRLDTVRDAAVTTGAVASGGAAIIGARQWAKTNREGRAAIQSIAPKLDPKEVVREGVKQIGDKAKGAAKEYFPTFTKGGKRVLKVLKKRLFSAVAPDAEAKAKAKAKEKRKIMNSARIRNGLVGAAAGSFLGGQVHGGASGYKGARVGAGLGAVYGVLSDPKRRAAIDQLQTASFCTPASALFEFGGKEQWREEGTNTYADPLKVASGLQRAYHRTDGGGRPVIEAMPIAHAQTIKAALNKADKIKRTANRGGSLAKDVVATISGKPRERDAAGRVKKREWEKPWFREGVKKAAIAGGILGGATVLKKSPKARAAVRKASRKGAKWANSIIPGSVPHQFSDETPKTNAVVAGMGGAVTGALVGDAVAKRGKAARAYVDLVRKKAMADAQRQLAPAKKIPLGTPQSTKPFSTGKLTNAERLQRGVHEARVRYQKGLKRKPIKGGVIGAAAGAGLSLGVSKLRQKEKGREFQMDGGNDVHEFGKPPYRAVSVKRYPGQPLRPGSARGTWARHVAGTYAVPAKGSEEAVEAAKKIRIYKGNPVGKEVESVRKQIAKDPQLSVQSKMKGTPGLAVKDRDGMEIYKKGSREIKDAIDTLNVDRARGKRVKVHKNWNGAPYVETGFSTPASKLFHFDEIAQDAGWDIRDPRGRSARVFAPGSRKRDRREKAWHEKIENERKLWKAGVGAAAVAGLVAGGKLKKGPAAAGKVVKPGGISMAPSLKPAPATPIVRGIRKAPARRLRPAGE